MKRITLSSLLAVLLLLTAGLGATLAAPVNNPHAEFFTLECDDGESYDMVVAHGNPAHILDSTSKLIPHHFTFALIVEGEEAFSESAGVGQGKKTGLQGRLMTCTLELELTAEDIELIEEELDIDLTGAEVMFHLAVQVMKTPAGR